MFTEGTKFGDTTVKQVISEARDQALSQSRDHIQREAMNNSLNQESLNRWLPSTASSPNDLPPLPKVGDPDS